MLERKLAAPRGILHIPANYEPFPGLQRFQPSDALAPFVEHYWEVIWKDQPKVLRETVPHPAVHLVLESDASLLHGVYQKKFSRSIEGTGRVLGVKFRPGGFRTFLKESVSKLTNRVVHPLTIFGPPIVDLESRAISCSNTAKAFELVDNYLTRLNPIRTPELDTVGQIMEAVATDRSIIRAEFIVERFSIGLRHLQRMFQEYVGVGPKWVIQRHRLIEAAERIRAGNAEINFAQLSLDLGYSDQAHFIRDFKLMVGMTPGKYRRSLSSKTQTRECPLN